MDTNKYIFIWNRLLMGTLGPRQFTQKDASLQFGLASRVMSHRCTAALLVGSMGAPWDW